MSMFIEVFSEDVAFHGDGASSSATIQLIGWPFNLDLSEAADFKVAAMLVEGEPETLTQIDCTQSNTFVTIHFPEPIPGGESKVVRLRVKVFV